MHTCGNTIQLEKNIRNAVRAGTMTLNNNLSGEEVQANLLRYLKSDRRSYNSLATILTGQNVSSSHFRGSRRLLFPSSVLFISNHRLPNLKGVNQREGSAGCPWKKSS